MARGHAYLVVGHKQWGKSRTLKSLTGESHQIRTITIAERQMFIRRMSNDDKPSDFRELIRALRPGEHEHVILAFCPVFDKDAADVLQDLHKHYDISAFVLKHSFDRRDQISEKEIASLRDFGDIEVFDQHAGPTERAAALRAFIERHFH